MIGTGSYSAMDIFPPPILLEENGYRFLAATNGGDDSRLVMRELQGKIVRVGKGDFDVTVGWNGSTAPRCRVRNASPHSENLRLDSPTKSAIRSQVLQV